MGRLYCNLALWKVKYGTKDYEVPKKLSVLVLFPLIFLVSLLLSAEKQVRVIAERASVYAESNTLSYKIETIKKGTVLSVFESGTAEQNWLYIRYRSERWKSVVTGFIQASLVEGISGEPAETPVEKPKEEKIEPVEAPKKAAEEEKVPVPQREQISEDVQPKIEKPETKPAKIEPVIEQVSVQESVGISSLPPSTSYALPQVKMEEPKIFMSRETSPAITESIQKQEEAVEDATKKVPQKLEERRPPEKTVTEPEAAEKKEAVPKEEKPVEKKPEEKQIAPQITPQKPPQPKKPEPPGEWPFLTLSIGYGPAQGSGLGGFLQLNTKMGLSLHVGAGYYPTSFFYSEYDWVKNEVLFSGGIKYYLPLKSSQIHPYLSLQYGGISVEAVRIVTGIWNYKYINENIQKTLYGPSILAGIELKLGLFGLNGAVGLSYNLTDWNYWERDYFLTADIGLLIFLW